MRLPIVLSLAASCLILRGADQPSLGELHYRAAVTLREGGAPIVTRFVLTPTAIAETRNKVKKPRMGGWRLDAVQRKDEAFAQAAVLVRLERLLYLSGPVPELVQKPIYVRYGDRRCQVWQVPTPPGVQAYAYLVEAAPGLLALSYFSGSFDHGELASVELQLESFRLLPGAAPAENGTILLSTLRQLAAGSGNGADGGEETVAE